MAQAPQQQIQMLPPQQMQHVYLPPQHQMVYGGSTAMQNVNPSISAKDSKSYAMSNLQNRNFEFPQRTTFVLQPPKQPQYSPVPVHPGVQMMQGNNNIPQMPQRETFSAQPPAPVFNGQHPMLGQYALTPLPPGYSWATTSYAPQSPFIIRTPQPNIYVQQHPQPHMSMPPQQAITSQGYSEVPSNVVTSSMSPIHPPMMYSLPPNENPVPQYSQPYIPNQTNQPHNGMVQSMEHMVHNQGVAHNVISQSIETNPHNQCLQPVDHGVPITFQAMVSEGQNAEMPPIEPIVPSKINSSLSQPQPVMADSSNRVTPDSSNHYAETQNHVQFLETSSNNEAVDSATCSQADQSTESMNNMQLNHNGESQVDQSVQQTSCPANSVYSKEPVADSNTGEILNKALSMTYLPQQETQEPVASSNEDIQPPIASSSKSSSSTTSNRNSAPSSTTSKDSSKTPLKTYSYTVVSPSSTSQSDNNEEGNAQDSANDFYPIIKLKRLKPQDPLGKPDSTDKHPQKAIVKPQVLAPPESDEFQMADTSPSFSESLKISPTSPESLPLKKRKHFQIEHDSTSDTSPKDPDPILSMAVDPNIATKKRGRGRPRIKLPKVPVTPVKFGSVIPKTKLKEPDIESDQAKTPNKAKTPDKAKEPDKSKTPDAVSAKCTPDKPKTEQEVAESQTRRSSRRKAQIEIIEILDDNDNVKIENDTPKKKRPKQQTSPTLTQEALDTKPSEVKCDPSNESTLGYLEDSIKLEFSQFKKESRNRELQALSVMSVQEVCDFIINYTGKSEFGDEFKSQEIDGQALLLLNLDHLVTGFNMNLGPAVKLISYINILKQIDEE